MSMLWILRDLSCPGGSCRRYKRGPTTQISQVLGRFLNDFATGVAHQQFFAGGERQKRVGRGLDAQDMGGVDEYELTVDALKLYHVTGISTQSRET